MLPITSQDIIDFTPSDMANLDPKPIFKIAPLTIAQRSKYRHAVAQSGVRYVDGDEYLAALENAAKILTGEQFAAAQSLIAFLKSDQASIAKNYDADEIKTLAAKAGDLELALLENDVDLRRLQAERSYFTDMTVILAARHALRGWENMPVGFEKSSDGLVGESAFNTLSDMAILEIGMRALELMQPRGQVAKN
jgi:hypothetical protein